MIITGHNNIYILPIRQHPAQTGNFLFTVSLFKAIGDGNVYYTLKVLSKS